MSLLLILDDDDGASGNDVKEFLDILILQAHTAGRHLLPDAFGMKGAVNAVMRVRIKTHPTAAQLIVRALGGNRGPSIPEPYRFFYFGVICAMILFLI